jgi:hypothetical protein
VRYAGNIARVEVARKERCKFFDEKVMDDISSKIKATGFVYVALELDGYKTGSLNREIGKERDVDKIIVGVIISLLFILQGELRFFRKGKDWKSPCCR